MVNPLGFTPSEVRWLLLGYALFFVLPAIPVARHARRRGDHWLAWAIFILATSVVGAVSYWEHVAIQRRRSGEGTAGPGDDERTK